MPTDEPFDDDGNFDGDFDDDFDDGSPTPPPDPQDRLWRHPAEVAAAARAEASAHEAAVAGEAQRMEQFLAESEGFDRINRGPRRAFVLATAGLVGLLVIGGLQFGLGSPAADRTADVASGRSVEASTVARSPREPRSNFPNSRFTASTASPTADKYGDNRAPEWRSVLRQRVEAGLPTIEVTVGGKILDGRGIVIDESGHILTSASLLQGASHIIVWNESVRFEATVIGADPMTDVAVIAIDDASRPPASLGTEQLVQAGQYALIAEPGAEDLMVGQITKLGDDVQLEAGSRIYGLIEIDVPANVAPPGAAVFDDVGVIIGMMPGADAENLAGHAIPIGLAYRIGQQIIAQGEASHAWLGIQGVDSAALGQLSSGGGTSAQIMEIQRGGPADRAGLMVGDEIAEISGTAATVTVRSMGDLVASLRILAPGEQVTVSFYRDDQLRTTTVTLGTVSN